MNHFHNGNPTGCQPVVLANSELGEVSVCQECGIVHVSLQYFSVRLRVNAYQEFAQMLMMADANLDALIAASINAGEQHHPDADAINLH